MADFKIGVELDAPGNRGHVWRMLEDRNPLLTLFSPRRIAFAHLHNVSRDSAVYQEALKQCLDHFEFLVEITEPRLLAGAFVLFEHPARGSFV